MAPPAVFPIAKLIYLGIKQAAKPISNALTKRAKSNNLIRRYVVIPLGRVMYRVKVLIKMKEVGLRGKITRESKFAEEEMVEMGSKVLAEIIIFGIIGIFLVTSVNMSKKKTFDDDNKEDDELEQMKSKLLELDRLVNAQHEAVGQLEASLKMLLKRIKADT